MRLKVIKVSLIAVVVIVIGTVSFLMPYYAQQKSIDGFRVESEALHFVEENPRVGDVVEKNKLTINTEEMEIQKRNEQEAKEEKNIFVEVDEDDSLTHNKTGSGDGIIYDFLEVQVVNEDWIELKLKEYKDEIRQEDVEDFRRIIGKLDVDYATGLLDNPGGEEGENLLRRYLRSRLSEDEYDRGKELFFLYNHILLG